MSPDHHPSPIEEKGEHKLPQGRLYISCPVLTPEPLLAVQQDMKLREDFRPSPPGRFHVTLFHFGKPYEVYQEVTRMNPTIGPDELEGYHRHFVSQLLARISYAPFEVDCAGVEIDVYGDSDKPVVVVTLEQHMRIQAARAGLIDELVTLLRRCGITDPQRFIYGNHNLMYQSHDRYNPHVTLGTIDNVSSLPQTHSHIHGATITLGTPQLVR